MFYEPKKDFMKEKVNILGIMFDKPKFKRKNYPTATLYGVKHWFCDIFISAKTRIEIELVEKNEGTSPNFAKSGPNVRGAIVILNDVFLWTPSNGVMENDKHSITIINPIGDAPDDFIKDRVDKLEVDEFLSSNGCWRELIGREKTKMKQAIRLARYFRSYLSDKKINLEPRNELEKAVNNHYKISGELDHPQRQEEPVVGVAVDLKENLKISISPRKNVMVVLNDNIRTSYAMEWFRKAVNERLLLVFTNFEREKKTIRITSTIGVYQLDGAMEFLKRNAYYSDILSVRFNLLKKFHSNLHFRERYQNLNLRQKPSREQLSQSTGPRKN